MAVDFFATLLLAHLLADFPLQTNTIAAMKSKSIHGLLMHVGVYMAATWALLGFGLTICPLVMLLGVAHFAVDWLKVRAGSQKPVRSFVFDQFAHMVCMISATGLVSPWFFSQPHFVLPPQLLYPALSSGLFLAAMVMYWVWASSLEDEMLHRYSHLRWCRERLLDLEQRAGFGLLCALGVAAILLTS